MKGISGTEAVAALGLLEITNPILPGKVVLVHAVKAYVGGEQRYSSCHS
jgi:hypothetical protein